MYSLIITIIAIALVAALALATLYYGGDALNKTDAEAQAAKVIAQGQQVSGAYQLRSVDERAAPIPSVDALIPEGYLTSIPSHNKVEWRTLTANSSLLWLPQSVSEEVCKIINFKINRNNGIPQYPVKSWSKQCYGDDATGKYNVLWDGIGLPNLATVVSEAVSKGTDTKNTEVPTDLVVAVLPDLPTDSGNTGGSGGSGDTGGSGGSTNPDPGGPPNNWTVPPTTYPRFDGVLIDVATSVVYNRVNKYFWNGTTHFSGGPRLENGNAKIVSADMECNGQVVITPKLSSRDGILFFHLDDPETVVHTAAMNACPSKPLLDSLIIHYDNGSKKVFQYGLMVVGKSDNESKFNVGFNPAGGFFDKPEIKVPAADLVANEDGAPLSRVTLNCKTTPGSTFIEYGLPEVPFYVEAGNLVLNLKGIHVDPNWTYSMCAEGSNLASVSLQYDWGSSKSFKYTLNFIPYDDLAKAPEELELSRMYQAITANMPHPVLANDNNYVNSGNYGFLLSNHAYDHTKFNIISAKVVSYAGCSGSGGGTPPSGGVSAFKAELNNCTRVEAPAGYYAFKDPASAGTTHQPIYLNEIINYAYYSNMQPSSFESAAYVVLSVEDVFSGKKSYLVKPFNFETNPADTYIW